MNSRTISSRPRSGCVGVCVASDSDPPLPSLFSDVVGSCCDSIGSREAPLAVTSSVVRLSSPSMRSTASHVKPAADRTIRVPYSTRLSKNLRLSPASCVMLLQSFGLVPIAWIHKGVPLRTKSHATTSAASPIERLAGIAAWPVQRPDARLRLPALDPVGPVWSSPRIIDAVSGTWPG